MSDTAFTELRKIEKEVEQCMKCGFCTFVCPVYQEEKVEASVARGKNELVKRLLSGELELNPELATRLYKCTGCMTCTANCPARAPIAQVVIAARADIARTIGMRSPYGFIYRHLLPNRGLLGNILSVASRFQSLFMPKTDGVVRHLPDFMAALGKGRQIPSVAPKFLRRLLPEVNRPKGKTVMRIGYFAGCMNEFVTPQLGVKTVELLARHGVEVVMPRAQGCCGAAIFLGAGDFETARTLSDSNVKVFEGFDYIVTDCATCTCALTEYPRFLADTPERKEAYAKFAGKIRHASQFLIDVLKLPASAFQTADAIKGKKLTWHDPCHLNRYAGVKEQPRRILESLADARYVEMPNADRCCGMGGQFNLLNYDLSMKIAEKKADGIEAADADIVVTACPGCQIQLLDVISRRKTPQRVMSLMEVLK
jgi:glycolate oxidase iron-sulfur subunit